MATELFARANTKRDLLVATTETIATTLAARRTELSRTAIVGDRAQWAVDLGAAQHVEVARIALADLQDGERTIRDKLAAITNPAEAQTFEDDLRSNLIAQAQHRVERRLARERQAAVDAEIAEVSALHQQAQSALAAATTHRDWAEQHQASADGLLTAVEAAPLSTMVTDSDVVMTGADFTDADARLTDLLPVDLRTRATERYDEAATVVAEAGVHAQDGQAAIDALGTHDRPLDVAVAAGERAYVVAEAALGSYVSGAAIRLAAATGTLRGVTAHAELSAVQETALDEANNVAAAAAVADEGVLAASLVAVRAAEHAVDDAVLAAIAADPEGDPLADAAVQAAIAARDHTDLQDPLATARAGYDSAAQDALDAWEVEVPPSVWTALLGFLGVQRTLEELSDAGTVPALIAALGTTQDDLAAALDTRDDAIRARLAVGLSALPRTGSAAAAQETLRDRQTQYLRGDGPSGRVPAEL